jgi:photosystem II stability/assembly factor-like uncharacterized protein
LIHKFFLIMQNRLNLPLLMIGMLAAADTQAQWTQTEGPSGSVVQTIAVQGENIYCGTRGGGVYRSTNHADSWTPVNNGLKGFDVKSLLVAGVFLIAGTQDSGLFRSSDKGSSWSQINNGLATTSIQSLAEMKGVLFAGTQGGGVYRSSDTGKSWVPINRGLRNSGGGDLFVGSLAVQGEYIFATLLNGRGFVGGFLFRSSDQGESWSQLEPLFGDGYTLIAIDGNIYFGTVNYRGGGGLYRSTDNGATWTKVWAPFLMNPGIGRSYFSDPICMTSMNGTLILGSSGSGIFRSSDNGATWTRAIGESINTNVLAITSAGTTLLAGTDGRDYGAEVSTSWSAPSGLFRSVDSGVTWNSAELGLTLTPVRELKRIEGNLFATAGDAGLHRSPDNGKTWTYINQGIAKPVYSLAVSGKILYAASDQGQSYRSTNNGDSWTRLDTNLAGYENSLVASGGGLFSWGPEGDVFRSSLNGGSWLKVYDGSTMPKIQSLVDLNGALIGVSDGLIRSFNRGETWAHVGDTFLDTSLHHLVVNDGKLFGATAKGVYRSLDSGTTWSPVTTEAPGAIGILAASKGSFFAVTGEGVFAWPVDGNSWRNIAADLSNTQVGSFCASDDYLFAGTYSKGVWKRNLWEINTPIRNTHKTPVSYGFGPILGGLLLANSDIEFTLQKTSPVNLSLYDAAGSKTATLVRKILSPGTYHTSLAGSTLPGGLYFLRFQTPDLTQTQRILIGR